MKHSIYKVYKWIFVVPVLAVSTTICGLLAVILCLFMDPKIVSQVCGVTWARINSFVTPMRVRVLGRENMDPNKSYVICANHQSQYDIFVLYGWIGVDFKWVMKQELRKVPFLGVACAKLGHIFIDRSNTERAVASINAAREKVVNGTSVLFFPEGTRSRDGNMLRFKKGAFNFAQDLGLPILPVTIIGTKDILPSDTIDLHPGNAVMIIHQPIDTTDYGPEALPELMAKTREVIQKGLDWKPLA